MKISIGNDHAGVDLKETIIHIQKAKDMYYTTMAPITQKVDYADFIHPVAQDVEDRKVDMGIIICGSGNGAAMTANKHEKIRAALCWSADISKLSRQHNDANIISIPARFISKEKALEMVDLFITTPFEGGRHQKRIEKIPCS